MTTTSTPRSISHRNTIWNLRFELKRDAFLTADLNRQARKFLRDSRKFRPARKQRPAGADPRTQGKLGPTPQNVPHKAPNAARADSLLSRCLYLRGDADSYAYAQRNRVAALALLRGKPCPGNPDKLDASFLAIWVKAAGLAPTEAAAIELALAWIQNAKDNLNNALAKAA